MDFAFLRRFSANTFAAVRRQLERWGDWIEDRPWLAAWVYPGAGDNAKTRYREFNGKYFADFFQQERMLADRRRMDFYYTAVTRHVKPGDRVVDLGTGTGILANFAARNGAAKVYAIDHSAILLEARKIAAHNGVANIEFIATHSSKFSVESPVDLIIHEQMGDCLFDEDMVANVTDLRKRLLKPEGRILPSHFELFCEPIKLRDDRRVPFIWELNVHGVDYACMERERPQNPDYYRMVSCDSDVVEYYLAQPEPAVSIDLHTVDEETLPRELTLRRTVVRGGRLDGFAIYFRANVDDDLTLSTDPLNPERAPHWGYRILRTEAETFCAGDVIELRLTVGRWAELDSWRWSYTKA